MSMPELQKIRNRRSTGFVHDLDLTSLVKNLGNVGKAAKNSISGKSGKKLRAYSPRSARARNNEEQQNIDECASNLHRLFVTERLGEADVSEDLVDFFGMQFLDQDSRFPVWLQRRQDFQSVCPRFCETDENFLQIKSQIPEELLLRKAFKMSPLLSNLHHIMMSKLIKRCETQDFPAHSTVVEQGDVADKIFVVLEGTLDVAHKPKTGDKVQQGVLTEGLIFGDVGYETQTKRLSTVTTRTPCRLAIIDCSLYREVVHVERERQVRQLVEWISDEVPWAASLSKRKVTMLAHLVTPRKLRPGEYVYHEGDSAENIYIVKSGVCVAVKIFAYKQEHRWPTAHKDWGNKEVTYNREAVLREYREGDVFGEEPFADENCRLWGVKAVDIGPLEAEVGSRSQEVEILQIDAAACLRQKDGSAVLPQRMCNMIKEQWRKESEEAVRRTEEEQDCVMIRDMVKGQAIRQECSQRYLERRHIQDSAGSFQAATDSNPVRVGVGAACLV
jgi:CRP-like cAMP-binding protein